MSAAIDTPPESDSPRRRRVLDAAAQLFIARGYGAVSMDEIARTAGVSKATLYAHFGSKDQLFETIIRDGCQAGIGPDFLPSDETDLRRALTALGGRALRFLLQEQSLAIFRVVLAENVRFPELGRAFYEGGPGSGRRLIADWLTKQARSGRLVLSDPSIAAEQLMALLRAGLHFRATLGVPPPPTEAEIDATVKAAVDTFLKAFGVPSAAGSTET